MYIGEVPSSVSFLFRANITYHEHNTRSTICLHTNNNNNNIYLKSNIHSITRYKFSRLYKKHGIHNLAVQCILKYQEKAST